MFNNADDTGGTPTSGKTKRYHGVARRGVVISRSPFNPETNPPEKVPPGNEPVIQVKPNSSEKMVEVTVPQRYAQATGTPREDEVVYFMTTNTDRSILLGVAGTDHDGYIDEREIPHQHKDNDITFTETGRILISSRNEPAQDPRDQVPPEATVVEQEAKDTERTPIETGTTTLDTRSFDITLERPDLTTNLRLTDTLDAFAKSVRIENKEGDTVTFTDSGSVVVNGGNTAVITDVEATVNTDTDSNGHVTNVSVNLDVTRNDDILVNK